MSQSNEEMPRRAGLPAANSIVSEGTFTPRRRAGVARAAVPTYRILRTTEIDPKDVAATAADITPVGTRAIPSGDEFAGTARKSAKLTIASASTEQFTDLQPLLASLPAKDDMVHHDPEITTDSSSGRVTEEKRNVRLRAYIYAASREADNDFHLIIGRETSAAPHVYMTAEISGLPPRASAAFSTLNAARDSFKEFLNGNLPEATYDFYDPPIPIEIEGSLFFDMSHAHGEGPGPQSLRKDMPTIWEIHPVSKIVFEP